MAVVRSNASRVLWIGISGLRQSGYGSCPRLKFKWGIALCWEFGRMPS